MNRPPHATTPGPSSMRRIALVALAATLTAPALGQFGDQAGFTEVFKPDYRRDMQLYSDISSSRSGRPITRSCWMTTR